MMSDLHEVSAMVIITTLANPDDKRIGESRAIIGKPRYSLEDLEN
jgi:hypothetical protein